MKLKKSVILSVVEGWHFLIIFSVFILSAEAGAYKISDLKGNTSPVDYLVITTDSFISAITSLLDHRANTAEYDDVDNPAAVAVEDIYQAFPDSLWPHQKVHTFLRYAYQNWQGHLKYVLLLGNGHIGPDKRQPGAIVPFFPEIVPDIVWWYDRALDDSVWISRFGRTNDIDSLIDCVFYPRDYYYSADSAINDTVRFSFRPDTVPAPHYVTRVPAVCVRDVETFVSKTIAWDTTVTGAYTRMVNYFIVDNFLDSSGIEPLHFTEGTEILTNDNHFKDHFIPLKFYGIDYPVDSVSKRSPDSTVGRIYENLKQESGWVTLNAHGNFTRLAFENFMLYPRDTTYFANISGSFFLDALVCYMLGKDYELHDTIILEDTRYGIAPALLLDNPTGACGVLGCYQTTYLNEAQDFRRNLYKVLSTSCDTSISEIIYNRIFTDFKAEPKKYAYLGDPALRLFQVIGHIDTVKVRILNDYVSLTIEGIQDKYPTGEYELTLTGYIKGDSITGIDPRSPNDTVKFHYETSPLPVFSKTMKGTGFDFSSLNDLIIQDSEFNQVSILGVYIRGNGWDIFRVIDLDTVLINIGVEESFPEEPAMPLLSVMPNPFNPSTSIFLNLKSMGPAGRIALQVSIFDINGRQIEHIIRTVPSNSITKIVWNASKMPSGIYFAHILVNTKEFTQRLVLLR